MMGAGTMGSLADRYSVFLLDLDGVLYLLNDPIPGSSETVRKLAEAGKGIVFLTNNSSATPAQYVEKLARFDILTLPDQIISSADAARRYLERSCETAGKTAFMIGEDGLRSMLAETGLKVVDGEEARSADFVCVGWDRRDCNKAGRKIYRYEQRCYLSDTRRTLARGGFHCCRGADRFGC